MRTFSALRIWIFVAALFGSMDSLASTRNATIAWRSVDGAVTYQLEIARTPEMDPLVLNKQYRRTRTTVPLKPGTYYFRVRGLDSEQAPGPWSDVEGFVVNPGPPKPLSPRPKTAFRTPLKEEGIQFKWDSGLSGTEYLFEVRDNEGVLLSRSVDDTEIRWKPKKPGRYAWRVGYKTPTGEEWSPYTVIGVYPSALPVPVVTVVDSAEVEDPNKPRRASWSLIGRAAEAIAAYTGDEPDLDIHTSGAALVTFFSAELRWQGGKRPDQLWTWSGSANFEMIVQKVLGETFSLPRGYARLFLGKESGAWRAGPFIQFQAGKSGLFLVENATSAIRATVSRYGGGIGGVAVYRPAPKLGLSFLALGRLDMGGQDPALPKPLKTDWGLEAGFGTTFQLSDRWMLEGRLRLLHERYTWTSEGGNGTAGLKNTFVLLDAGVGFHF